MKTVAILAAFLLAACGGTISPSVPAVAPSPAPGLRPANTAALPPTIATISPNVVSTAGTWGTITGTQFQPGTTLHIGGTPVLVVFRDSTTIQFASSGAHPPGTVDVVVTNPGAIPATLAGGYTFAEPESFDMNGEWIAHADARNDYSIDMRFTIKDNALVTLSCGVAVSMPTTVPAPNGRFSFAGPDGLALSGMLVSTISSSGHVSAPGCGDGTWWADKAIR